MVDFKEGDWVVFDLKLGQVKRLREDGVAEFSDGCCSTSGMSLADRFRPLTLRNKSIMETFDFYYNELRNMDGSGGFNFPDIFRFFSQLGLDAIDSPDNENKHIYKKAQEFVREARDYKTVIHGVRLFRKAA